MLILARYTSVDMSKRALSPARSPPPTQEAAANQPVRNPILEPNGLLRCPSCIAVWEIHTKEQMQEFIEETQTEDFLNLLDKPHIRKKLQQIFDEMYKQKQKEEEEEAWDGLPRGIGINIVLTKEQEEQYNQQKKEPSDPDKLDKLTEQAAAKRQRQE